MTMLWEKKRDLGNTKTFESEKQHITTGQPRAVNKREIFLGCHFFCIRNGIAQIISIQNSLLLNSLKTLQVVLCHGKYWAHCSGAQEISRWCAKPRPPPHHTQPSCSTTKYTGPLLSGMRILAYVCGVRLSCSPFFVHTYTPHNK